MVYSNANQENATQENVNERKRKILEHLTTAFDECAIVNYFAMDIYDSLLKTYDMDYTTCDNEYYGEHAKLNHLLEHYRDRIKHHLMNMDTELDLMLLENTLATPDEFEFKEEEDYTEIMCTHELIRNMRKTDTVDFIDLFNISTTIKFMYNRYVLNVELENVDKNKTYGCCLLDNEDEKCIR